MPKIDENGLHTNQHSVLLPQPEKGANSDNFSDSDKLQPFLVTFFTILLHL
jgi:hypothetical protein